MSNVPVQDSAPLNEAANDKLVPTLGTSFLSEAAPVDQVTYIFMHFTRKLITIACECLDR